MPFKSLTKKRVLEVAILSEGILIVVSLLWIHFRGPTYSPVTTEMIHFGVLATIPLLILNLIIFEAPSTNGDNPNLYKEFKREVICPICAPLDAGSALIVSILAGFGEELFFRGLMLYELTRLIGITGAVIITSFIFSIVHFGPTAYRYKMIATIYFFIGLLLSSIVLMFDNLLPVIIVHGLYNFFAILYVRYLVIPREFPAF